MPVPGFRGFRVQFSDGEVIREIRGQHFGNITPNHFLANLSASGQRETSVLKVAALLLHPMNSGR